MRLPIFVRTLSEEEFLKLKEGLHSCEAFTLRRCQIVLASASGLHSRQFAKSLSCASQTVRNAISAFNEKGLAALRAGSNRPNTVEPILKEANLQKLKALLHQSPRNFGKETSQWTLELVAQVCFETALTPVRLSDETIRLALKRSGVRWKRAKHWISSPDPEYARKKSGEIG